MKNKGFTLIELLAVIVVLSIVALISIPLVLGAIEKVRISSYKQSLRSVFKATDLYIASSELIDFPNEGINVTNSNIKLKNKEFTMGKIIKNEEGKVELDKVSNGKYCGSGTLNNLIVIEGGCELLDTTPPTITIGSNEITSNSITIVANAEDLDSGIKGYQFSKDNGATWTSMQTSNVYSFTELNNNTSYTFKVRVENGNKLTTTSNELVVSTRDISLPTYSIDNSDWTNSSVVVTINYPERQDGYIYEYSLDGAATWEEVASPAITKDIIFTSNGNIIARISDGVNVVSGVSYQVSNIDASIPIINFSMDGNNTYAKSKSTVVTVSDAISGVDNNNLKYLWKTNTTTPDEGDFISLFTNGDSIETPSGVTGNYYLWILGKDNAGNTLITRTNGFKIDNTIPVITLLGSSVVSIELNSGYIDAGVTATDNIDGNINSNVIVSGTVNTSAPGQYTLFYNVSDSSGNTASTVSRTINVVQRSIFAIETYNGANYGYLDRYTYNGNSWINTGGPSDVTWLDVEAIDENNIFVIETYNGANYGYLSKYTYNGSSWVRTGGLHDVTWLDVEVIDENNIFAIETYNGENYGYLDKYTYNGSSWVNVGGPSDVTWLDVAVIDENNIFAIETYNGENYGYLDKYTYNGSSWINAGGPSDVTWLDVEVIDENNIFAIETYNGENYGYLDKYTYNGSSWINAGGPSDVTWLDVEVIDENNIFAIETYNGENYGYLDKYTYNGSGWINAGGPSDVTWLDVAVCPID